MNFFRYLTINTFVITALLTVGMYGVASEKNIQAERPLPAGSPALVMQDCEPTAIGQYPTGVVIQKIGGGTFLLRKQKFVDTALDTALNGQSIKGIRILEFCA